MIVRVEKIIVSMQMYEVDKPMVVVEKNIPQDTLKYLGVKNNVQKKIIYLSVYQSSVSLLIYQSIDHLSSIANDKANGNKLLTAAKSG